MLQPKIFQPLDLKLLYQKLQQHEPRKVVYAQDALVLHQKINGILEQGRLDEYLQKYKDLVLDLLHKFQPCHTLLDLQFNYLVSLLYYINQLICQRRYTTAFQCCFIANHVFSQKKLNLPEKEVLAFQAQFYNLYGCIYYKQQKMEGALAYINNALQVDLKLLPAESFDRHITSLLNITYLLQNQYRAPEAAKYIKKALLNVSACHDTNYSYLFNQDLNKQRVGVATVIATHLNGMIEILRKDSNTPVQQWYQPFDHTLQLSIQYFARLDDVNNCWNNQIIAWALIDLEIVEQLARRQDKYFVGSLQCGRYENVKYYLYSRGQEEFKTRARNIAGEFLDEYATRKFYQATVGKSKSRTKRVGLAYGGTQAYKQTGKQRQGKLKKITTASSKAARSFQAQLLKKSNSVPLLHHFNQHYTRHNTELLLQSRFSDILGNIIMQPEKVNRVPQILKKKDTTRKTPLWRPYTPLLRRELVPKSIQTISNLINYKFGTIVDPFSMYLYDMNDIMSYDPKNSVRMRDNRPIDHQDEFTLFPASRYLPNIRLSAKEFTPQQLETLAAMRIQRFARHRRLAAGRRMQDKTNASIIIQRQARGVVAVLSYHRKIECARKIQAWLRCICAMRLRRNSLCAIQDIQRQYRGHSTRNKMINFLYHISKIQWVFQYQTIYRKYASICRAAVIIQRGYLSYRVRNAYFQNMKGAAIVIQRRAIVCLLQKQRMACRAAVNVIQCYYRMVQNRYIYGRKYRASLLIQSFSKQRHVRQKYQSVYSSAKRIQYVVRLKQRDRRQHAMERAARMIQVHLKYRQKCQNLRKMYHYPETRTIQGYMIGYLERQQQKQVRVAAITVQKHVECHRISKYRSAMLHSIKIIQQYTRRMIQSNYSLIAAQNKSTRALAIRSCVPVRKAQTQSVAANQNTQTCPAEADTHQKKQVLLNIQNNKYLRQNTCYVPPIARFAFRPHEIPQYQEHELYEIGGSVTVLSQRPKGLDNVLCRDINQIDIASLYRKVRPQRTLDKLEVPSTYVRVSCRFYSQANLPTINGMHSGLEDLGVNFVAERMVQYGHVTAEQIELIKRLLRHRSGTGYIDPFKFRIACLCFNYQPDWRDRVYIGQYVITVQSYARMFFRRREYRQLTHAATQIQKHIKKWHATLSSAQIKEALFIIQQYYRNHVVAFKKCDSNVCYSAFRNVTKITTIQRYARKYQNNMVVQQSAASAIIIQKHMRGKLAYHTTNDWINIVQRLILALRQYMHCTKHNNYIQGVKTVQRYARKYQYVMLKRRCQQIQYYYKITHNRPLNYTKDAMKLQACLKGALQQIKHGRHTRAAMIIQKYWRRWRQQMQNTSKEMTARLVQHLYRSNIGSGVQKFRTTVQRVQMAARTFIFSLHTQQHSDSAIRIQAAVRSRLVAVASRQRYVAVRRIQLHYRKIRIRMLVHAQYEQIIAIQRSWRGFRTRVQLLADQKQVVYLQRCFRSARPSGSGARAAHALRKTFLRQTAATRAIQKIARTATLRRRLHHERAAVVIIQQCARIFLARMVLFYARIAVAVIQRVYRTRARGAPTTTWVVRQMLSARRTACTAIQARYRGNRTRARVTAEAIAAIRIQTQQRSPTRHIFQAVRTIQGHFRGALDRDYCAISGRASMVLQSYVRRHTAVQLAALLRRRATWQEERISRLGKIRAGW